MLQIAGSSVGFSLGKWVGWSKPLLRGQHQCLTCVILARMNTLGSHMSSDGGQRLKTSSSWCWDEFWFSMRLREPHFSSWPHLLQLFLLFNLLGVSAGSVPDAWCIHGNRLGPTISVFHLPMSRAVEDTVLLPLWLEVRFDAETRLKKTGQPVTGDKVVQGCYCRDIKFWEC